MSIYWTETRYLSVSEVKSSSSNANLLLLTDDKILEIVVKAEFEVDSYLWFRFDDFSTLTSLEQQEIKIATLITVENIFNLSGSVDSLVTWLVKSESTWDRSVTYSDTKSWSKVISIWLPNSAKVALDKYKVNFYFVSV